MSRTREGGKRCVILIVELTLITTPWSMLVLDAGLLRCVHSISATRNTALCQPHHDAAGIPGLDIQGFLSAISHLLSELRSPRVQDLSGSRARARVGGNTSSESNCTLSTPPWANAPAHHSSTIESTLKSRGAHVVNENIGVVCVQAKEVHPWIQRDIEQVKQCRADAMLEALLHHTSCAAETKQPELLQSAPWKLCRSAMDRPLLETYSSGVVQDWVVAKILLGDANRTSEPEILKKVKEITKLHDTHAGHLDLWKEGVYHQDITPGNLMWYSKNGKLIVQRLNEAESKHLYRHDLESFISWVFLHYRQGVILPRGSHPFDEWATLDAINVLRRSIQLPTIPGLAFAIFTSDRRTGAGERTNDEESVSDMDDLLHKFTVTQRPVGSSWGAERGITMTVPRLNIETERQDKKTEWEQQQGRGENRQWERYERRQVDVDAGR
ncbi:hypothetical protein DFJ58DRAFT_915694 [Suillus subalutaceus]|uniref:uncharacterized protein n=1 Tax=Suillus subalutaceus TaxID=48586 RepID=UPI001B862F7C|nr:uncharacterized protein DFJ58DRAFT_915694 [Suillus subalutaceus]KAG1844809.1 hypothetical protein DFJ58DRAFT_915694 [Suillus subalutaceus]